MKKALICFLLPIVMLFSLVGCKQVGYESRISDKRHDLFVAESDEFSLTLSCISRETPYALDGVCGEISDLIEVALVPKGSSADEYSITILSENNLGGTMSYRSAKGDYFFSHGVESFPQSTVSLRIKWGDETKDLSATSVKNENTLTAEAALECAVAYEKAHEEQDEELQGEFHVRLLRRDKNYYYVGLVTADKTVALLLDAETGDVLARRVG